MIRITLINLVIHNESPKKSFGTDANPLSSGMEDMLTNGGIAGVLVPYEIDGLEQERRRVSDIIHDEILGPLNGENIDRRRRINIRYNGRPVLEIELETLRSVPCRFWSDSIAYAILQTESYQNSDGIG